MHLICSPGKALLWPMLRITSPAEGFRWAMPPDLYPLGLTCHTPMPPMGFTCHTPMELTCYSPILTGFSHPNPQALHGIRIARLRIINRNFGCMHHAPWSVYRRGALGFAFPSPLPPHFTFLFFYQRSPKTVTCVWRRLGLGTPSPSHC